ncbi:MAG TPA: DinB family protein, partial [Acidimicrobiales bacterium]|nr:DinB family protein [Acidimicrobiales bacterium]
MEKRIVTIPDGLDARVGEALWRLRDTRQRTLDALRAVEPDWVERAPVVGENTIGTLLYHVALIELDWLYADLLHEPFPDDTPAWFPNDVRDAGGQLHPIAAEPLDRHLGRL